MKDEKKAKRGSIRSFPNRSPFGLPFYIALPQTAPFANAAPRALFTLGG
jgi:hypothetical protein